MNMLITEYQDKSDLLRVVYDVLQLLHDTLLASKLPGSLEQLQSLSLRIMYSAASGKREEISAMLEEALDLVCTQSEHQICEKDSMLQQITAYLQEHYADQDLTISLVADHFTISGSNLSHYYKSRTGVSVSDQLQRIRMAAACQLLCETDQSIAYIAAHCGYAQPATFMRVFKKVNGVTPTEYRNNHVRSGS